MKKMDKNRKNQGMCCGMWNMPAVYCYMRMRI